MLRRALAAGARVACSVPFRITRPPLVPWASTLPHSVSSTCFSASLLHSTPTRSLTFNPSAPDPAAALACPSSASFAHSDAGACSLSPELAAAAVAVSPSAPASEVTHVFARFESTFGFFSNRLTVAFPENTPHLVLFAVAQALRRGLKNRPAGLDFSRSPLPCPRLLQTGTDWNRWSYSVAQREIEGALDPLALQGLLLDAMVNGLGCRTVSSSSTGNRVRETVTYVFAFDPTCVRARAIAARQERAVAAGAQRREGRAREDEGEDDDECEVDEEEEQPVQAGAQARPPKE